MKFCNSYKLVIVILSFLAVAGCGRSFLEQSPEATLTGANFWKTESDLKQGVVGAYRSLRDLGLFDYWLFSEMRSDNTTFQYNAAQRGQENREFVDQFMLNSANTLLQDFWQKSYTGIARCNDVLYHASDIDMTEESRQQAIGEVKVLRAFHYFNLVRQFGGVPLIVASAQSPDEAYSEGRASIDEVYLLIIADLQDAAEKLPSTYAASDKGRVTSGTANALLGKVYMTRKDFTQALSYLREVTSYSLMPDYADIFKPGFKNNVESIFEIQYLGSDANLSSNFMYQFAPFNSGNVVTQDIGTTLSYNAGWNTPTRDLIDAYEEGDTRKSVSLAENFELDGSVYEVPYVTKFNHGFVQPGQTDVNFPIIRYADVLLEIAECLNEQAFVPGGEAFELLNLIRNRAGLEAKTVNHADINLRVPDQESFRQAIMHERQVELAFENHRWYDLVRTGKAVQVLNEHGQRENAANPQYPNGTYQVTENKLLLPIPQREVDLDNLEQNPQ